MILQNKSDIHSLFLGPDVSVCLLFFENATQATVCFGVVIVERLVSCALQYMDTCSLKRPPQQNNTDPSGRWYILLYLEN